MLKMIDIPYLSDYSNGTTLSVRINIAEEGLLIYFISTKFRIK